MIERLRRVNIPGGLGAGLGAALVMLAVMALLRLTTNTASIPEILEETLIAIAGGQVVSTFINALGTGGKALLLVSVVEGTLVLGGILGMVFTRLWPRGLTGPGWRWPAGVVYGLAIGLGLNGLVLPLAGQGLFGTGPLAIGVTAPPSIATMLYGTDLAPLGLSQWLAMFVFGLTFGLALVALLPWPRAATAAAAVPAAATMDRRDFVRALGGAGLALAGGFGLWAVFARALAPPPLAGLVEVDLDATPTPAAVAQAPVETPMPPTRVPPTVEVPSEVPPPYDPPTEVAPTEVPPTEAPPTEVPVEVAPTEVPPPEVPPTEVPPTEVPPTEIPPTQPPTAVPTRSAFAGVKPILVPEITPTESFYVTTKNFIDPTVDGNTWQISFGGMADNPYTLTLADVKKMPVINRIQTLACISNSTGGDLIGNARWKGVSFRELILRAKPRNGVFDVVVRGADGYSDSFPLTVALDNDCVLVYEMNGEPLNQKHGYPARLLVPNIYGMKNCKWITQVEFVSTDYKGYWESQGWSDTAIYNTMSRIDYPNGDRIEAKPVYIGGIAFAGNRGIQRVEVSVDGGKTWADAQLRPALGKYTWVQWIYPWNPQPGSYTLQVRATDGDGAVQTSKKAGTFPDGATGYHIRTVRVG